MPGVQDFLEVLVLAPFDDGEDREQNHRNQREDQGKLAVASDGSGGDDWLSDRDRSSDGLWDGGFDGGPLRLLLAGAEHGGVAAAGNLED